MALPENLKINVGTSPNSGTGDPLRTAYQKSNAADDYLLERIENIEEGVSGVQDVLNGDGESIVDEFGVAHLPQETVNPEPDGEVLWFENYEAIEATPGEINTLYVDNSDGQIYFWTQEEGYQPEGQKVRVRPDMEQHDPNHPAYIFNKPKEETLTFRPFITTWNVAAGDTIALPLGTTQINDIEVDWGDGTIERNDTNDAAHTYEEAGQYQIKIRGRLDYFVFPPSSPYASKITGIIQMGDIEWNEVGFRDTVNLKVLPEGEVPNFINVLTLVDCFRSSGITYIPEGFLDKATNCVDFVRFCKFAYDLEVVPPQLFKNCVSAKRMNDCFFLTKVKPSATLLQGLFSVISVRAMFRTDEDWPDEDKISSIPEDLLYQMPNLEDVSYMFFGHNINEVPEKLVSRNPKIKDLSEMFRYNPIGGVLPGLWYQYPDAIAGNAFSHATNAINYSEVPHSWGGPAGVPMPPQIPVQTTYWDTSLNKPVWLVDGVWRDSSGAII